MWIQIMEDFYRIDYVFSYWIFAWFLLFFFGLTKFSPFFILLLGVIQNTIGYFIEVRGRTIVNQLIFIIGNFFIKLAPVLYFIIRKQAHISIIDIIVTFIVFMVYTIWMMINNRMDKVIGLFKPKKKVQ